MGALSLLGYTKRLRSASVVLTNPTIHTDDLLEWMNILKKNWSFTEISLP